MLVLVPRVKDDRGILLWFIFVLHIQMSLSNEAVAVMLRRSDGTQELVPLGSTSGRFL